MHPKIAHLLKVFKLIVRRLDEAHEDIYHVPIVEMVEEAYRRRTDQDLELLHNIATGFNNKSSSCLLYRFRSALTESSCENFLIDLFYVSTMVVGESN